MDTYIELRALTVKRKIEEDLRRITTRKIEVFFDNVLKDRRAMSFIVYYNRTVLDREKINFGEFKYEWAIQGMTKEVYKFFDMHIEKLKDEILKEKNIYSFFEKYCVVKRREAAFCCKLFHTFLPHEFPPLDNPIRKHFQLQREDFIKAASIIKKGYELFIKDNQQIIRVFRTVLKDAKYSFLRIVELSDMRILDMYYWSFISRKKKTPNHPSGQIFSQGTPSLSPSLLEQPHCLN